MSKKVSLDVTPVCSTQMLPQFVVLKHPFVDSYLHITSIHDNTAIILLGLLSIWTLLILLQVPVDKYYLVNYEPTLNVQNFSTAFERRWWVSQEQTESRLPLQNSLFNHKKWIFTLIPTITGLLFNVEFVKTSLNAWSAAVTSTKLGLYRFLFYLRTAVSSILVDNTTTLYPIIMSTWIARALEKIDNPELPW